MFLNRIPRLKAVRIQNIGQISLISILSIDRTLRDQISVGDPLSHNWIILIFVIVICV